MIALFFAFIARLLLLPQALSPFSLIGGHVVFQRKKRRRQGSTTYDKPDYSAKINREVPGVITLWRTPISFNFFNFRPAL